MDNPWNRREMGDELMEIDGADHRLTTFSDLSPTYPRCINKLFSKKIEEQHDETSCPQLTGQNISARLPTLCEHTGTPTKALRSIHRSLKAQRQLDRRPYYESTYLSALQKRGSLLFRNLECSP